MTRSGRDVTVVIPALDEAETVAAAVRSARGATRVIVADGGSSDETAARAARAGAEVIEAPRGRASQMNAGARIATDADVLLFLHADTTLPPEWLGDVREVLGRPRHVAGAFDFSVGDGRVRDRVITTIGSARARVTRHPYGDQALFLPRTTFSALGGFPERALMEDWELVRRLRAIGRVGIARQAITTSTRQWDDGGLVRSTALYLAVIAGYRAGASDATLARLWRLGLDAKRAPRV